jgi:hypothetical protein
MATTPSTSCKDNEKAKQRFERTKPTAGAIFIYMPVESL